MTVPPLDHLPPPPPDKDGWPWTASQEPAPSPVPEDGWPRISIITPSYNQGAFLERTMRSVLLQGYPNLEYIVIDGASTDDSVAIIEKYAEFLSYWVSEPDRGQSHAINKGLKRCTGDIIAFLNSDDYYLPETFVRVARLFAENPSAPWLTGICLYYDEEAAAFVSGPGYIRQIPPLPDDRSRWVDDWPTNQPATFWRRLCFKKAGNFREDLDLVFDTEFMVRLLFHGLRPLIVDEEFAVYALHGSSKTVAQSDHFIWDAEKFRWTFFDHLSSSERQSLFWRNLVRGYSVRLRRRGRLPAYLFLLEKAIRHPQLFLTSLQSRKKLAGRHA